VQPLVNLRYGFLDGRLLNKVCGQFYIVRSDHVCGLLDQVFLRLRVSLENKTSEQSSFEMLTSQENLFVFKFLKIFLQDFDGEKKNSVYNARKQESQESWKVSPAFLEILSPRKLEKVNKKNKNSL